MRDELADRRDARTARETGLAVAQVQTLNRIEAIDPGLVVRRDGDAVLVTFTDLGWTTWRDLLVTATGQLHYHRLQGCAPAASTEGTLSMGNTDSTYTYTVTNGPDADGHYAARVYRNEKHVKTVYDEERSRAIDRVRGWIAADRTFDPDDVETFSA